MQGQIETPAHVPTCETHLQHAKQADKQNKTGFVLICGFGLWAFLRA